jgi:hypothetical protein
VNNASDNWPYHFVITYTEDEIRASRNAAAGRHARGRQGMTFYGLAFASILAIGLVVLGAFKLGLIAPMAVQPVLMTAFAAFTAGVVGYYLFIRQYFRSTMRAQDGWQKRTWNCSFDDAGTRYASDTIELRLAWRVLDAVDVLGRMVLLRYGRGHVAIPSRVFSSDAARAAFVTTARERIKAAADQAS